MNGTLIRERRKAKGWDQRDLAAEARVPQSFISRLETGERQSASLRTAKRLAAALEISVDDLLAEPVAAPAESPAA